MFDLSISGMVFCLILIAWLSFRIKKQDGSPNTFFRFSWYRSSFEKRPEPLYTENRKINRHWKPFS